MDDEEKYDYICNDCKNEFFKEEISFSKRELEYINEDYELPCCPFCRSENIESLDTEISITSYEVYKSMHFKRVFKTTRNFKPLIRLIGFIIPFLFTLGLGFNIVLALLNGLIGLIGAEVIFS